MDTYIFLLLLSGTARLVLSYGASWNMMSVTLQRGQDLELVCTATDTMNTDVMRITKTADDGSVMRVADSDGPSNLFRNLPRCKFTYQQRGSVAILTFRYEGIEPEDGGVYRCFKLYVPEYPDAVLTVRVNVPLSDLYISSHGTSGERRYTDGEVLHLNDDTSLECRGTIAGSSKPPTMWIHIGSEDVSDDFVSTSKNTSVSTYGSLTYWNSETSMVYDSARGYDPIYNNRKLVCFAQAEGYENVNTSVLLNFTYSPIIHCGQSVYFVSLGDPIAVSCNVSMNPFGVTFFLGWVPGMLEMSQPFDSGGRVVTTLYTISVENPMYRNYTLVATNSLGTQRVSFAISPTTGHSEDLEGHSSRSQYSQLTHWVCLLLIPFLLQ